jgi:hypothetical protein
LFTAGSVQYDGAKPGFRDRDAGVLEHNRELERQTERARRVDREGGCGGVVIEE